ncbi:hypothetical protein N802_18900 [Knoellia sinensis KCTC 19936]|uniref:DUF3515 domain-containing protein n=1 Tax=Knoellia sinensis KCTC 19936 TaxID=1385520 RepID=A0A0A0J3S8_9MICO|nr:DUF3515 family protein [Knoellia sinensis]KGN31838.1 hypothetical protein N802_18900 [Knoellia sinensis KCTC 19936]
MPTRIRSTAVALGATAVVVLSGCSSAVEIAPTPLATGDVCRDVASAWPASAGDHARREVTDANAGAAYGDPAIIARCGVPALGPTTDDCIEVDEMGWVASKLSDGTRFTTFGRDPAIEVLIPSDYAPEPLLLPAFTAAAEKLPKNTLACR